MFRKFIAATAAACLIGMGVIGSAAAANADDVAPETAVTVEAPAPEEPAAPAVEEVTTVAEPVAEPEPAPAPEPEGVVEEAPAEVAAPAAEEPTANAPPAPSAARVQDPTDDATQGSGGEDNTNNTPYWENQYPGTTCYKDMYGTVGANTVTLGAAPAGTVWAVLIVKSGSVGDGNAIYVNPVVGTAYITPLNGGGNNGAVSHYIVCSKPAPVLENATANVVVTPPTCDAPSGASVTGLAFATLVGDLDLSVGTHTATFISLTGHLFSNGTNTLTVDYTIAPQDLTKCPVYEVPALFNAEPTTPDCDDAATFSTAFLGAEVEGEPGWYEFENVYVFVDRSVAGEVYLYVEAKPGFTLAGLDESKWDIAGDSLSAERTILLAAATGNCPPPPECIDLSTADTEALVSLDGINAVLAARIIAAQPFTSQQDLVNRVSGIGAVSLANILSDEDNDVCPLADVPPTPTPTPTPTTPVVVVNNPAPPAAAPPVYYSPSPTYLASTGSEGAWAIGIAALVLALIGTALTVARRRYSRA